MDLKIFLDKFDTYLQESRVIFFTHDANLLGREGDCEYPLLFFSMLHNKLKEKPEQFICMDVMEHEPEQLSSQLSMSFLGLNARYWLRSFHELDAKKKKYWLSYINTYQGPHQILCYSDSRDFEKSEKITLVQIPELADAKRYDHLLTFFKPAIKNKQFAQSLFANHSITIPFDMVCLIQEYHAVIGTGTEEFIKDWISKIVPS